LSNAYREKVRDTYKRGTFRFGNLDNISLVGTVSEESGGYIPDVLDMLEESPFLRLVYICFFSKLLPNFMSWTFDIFQTMPWGELSHLKDMHPAKSNDGPILWMRPGEQSIPTVELGKSPLKRRRFEATNLTTFESYI